ncbi:pseudouridine synthase [Acidobacteriota bacterium]
MIIRLNKFLSNAGVASRRDADRLIVEGRIAVNNEVVQTLGAKVDGAKDVITIDGKKIKPIDQSQYLILNKPPGYLVTLKDPLQRPTILDLLPDLKTRVFPVGRLDFDSEGLLLLTNDGELANRLMHPRYGIKKVYLVKVKNVPERSRLQILEQGIRIDGKKTAPAKVKLLKSGSRRALIRIELTEGRKREVRKMFEAIGHPVRELKRIQFAELNLKNLKRGHWRHLTPNEISNLKKITSLTHPTRS